MNIVVAQLLLKACSRQLPKLTLSIVRRGAGYNNSFCDELYALSNAMVKESRDHWQQHIDSNHEIHVFRDCSNRPLGFQCWKFSGLVAPKTLIIRGGKLRLAHEIRGHGLHQLLNLVSLTRAKTEFGKAEIFWRVALVNLIGFNALYPSLARSLTPPLPSWAPAHILVPEFQSFCTESGFCMNEQTGRVDSGQSLLLSPDDFDEVWWTRPAVTEFRSAGKSKCGHLSRTAALSGKNFTFLC